MSFALSKLPASQFNGLSGAESDIRAMMAWHTDCNVHAGLQAVFNISRQISPVCSRKLDYDTGPRGGDMQSIHPLTYHLEMNIWMKDLGLEPHIWSHQRVLLRNL